MADLQTRLQSAFEDDGYDVHDVSRNRDTLREVLTDEGAEADDLRAVVHDVVDESDVLALNVTTESVDGQGMSTVVSVRQRG